MEPTTLTKIAKSRGYRVISDTEDDRILQINHPFDLIKVQWRRQKKIQFTDIPQPNVWLYILDEPTVFRTQSFLFQRSCPGDLDLFKTDFFEKLARRSFRGHLRSEEKELELFHIMVSIRDAIHANNSALLPARQTIRDMFDYIRAENTFNQLDSL